MWIIVEGAEKGLRQPGFRSGRVFRGLHQQPPIPTSGRRTPPRPRTLHGPGFRLETRPLRQRAESRSAPLGPGVAVPALATSEHQAGSARGAPRGGHARTLHRPSMTPSRMGFPDPTSRCPKEFFTPSPMFGFGALCQRSSGRLPCGPES